jgi:RHS repeat-associated protein
LESVSLYYPYGTLRQSARYTNTQETKQYLGEDYDTETQLSYLNARYYTNSRGQFNSQDPIFWSTKQNLRSPQSLNSYSYAEGNPVAWKDPSGLATKKGSIREIKKGFIKVLTEYKNYLIALKKDPKGTAKATAKSTGSSVKEIIVNPGGIAYNAANSVRTTIKRYRNGNDAEQDAIIGQIVVSAATAALPDKKLPGGVIKETLKGSGEITSTSKLSSIEALTAGEQFLGPGYVQLGKSDSGVFRSADNLRQFRIDNGSITHPQGAHVSFEAYTASNLYKPYVNNHVYLID